MNYFLLLHMLFVVALVTHQVVVVESCTCMPSDPFEEICMSDLAVNATVLSENITYPEGSGYDPWDIYDVQYVLDIHDVFTPYITDADSLPSVLKSYGPGSLCGLSLEVGATYILAGYISTDAVTGEKMLGMMLCNLHIYVNGPWGSYYTEAEEIMKQIDCSNPPDMAFATNLSSIYLSKTRSAGKHEKKASVPAVKAPRKSTEGDQFTALLSGINRRELKNGIESFFSNFFPISKTKSRRSQG